MTELAPIAIFTYKRPKHTRKTMESLVRNDLFKKSKTYIFCDGPKIENDRDVFENKKVVNYYKSQNVEIFEEPSNIGLANSIISGVSRLLEKHKKVIVLEDDLVISPYFLEFMNHSLEKYKNNKEVMQISGYMFPVEIKSQYDSFFMPLTTSWGWATWRDSWSLFDKNTVDYKLLENSEELRSKFNLGNTIDYFNMLKKQKAGFVDSWAIRWYLSVFMNNGLVLYPRKTLVENKGMDGTGTHRSEYKLSQKLSNDEFRVKTYPESIESIDMDIFQRKIQEMKLYKQPLLNKVLSNLRNIFNAE